jgi:hypothetical protein
VDDGFIDEHLHRVYARMTEFIDLCLSKVPGHQRPVMELFETKRGLLGDVVRVSRPHNDTTLICLVVTVIAVIDALE